MRWSSTVSCKGLNQSGTNSIIKHIGNGIQVEGISILRNKKSITEEVSARPLHSYGSFYIYCDMFLYLKKKLVNYTRNGVVMVIIFIQLSFPNKFTTFSANTLLSDTTKENFSPFQSN